MSTVIQVDCLWKKYRLGAIGTGTLAHDLNRWWHRVRGKPDPYLKIGAEKKNSSSSLTGSKSSTVEPLNPSTSSPLEPFNRSTFEPPPLGDDEAWALRDINFEVKQGEILGIIGRNGAGKSTLLKILSRVTAPTHGQVRVKGRIASLLEVGTGFHPELTGRENIFLNGAILGMTKAEIRSKLDEIIAFAEIEKYINTPVKRYSSGMYVRLAFAVAAHLDPEILIVDEVLAVGDAEFQKKCLGKMRDVSANQGRTVLFVSHNMPTVQRLCTQVVLLEQGEFCGSFKPDKAVDHYLKSTTQTIERSASISLRDRKRLADSHGQIVRIERVELTSSDGEARDEFKFAEPFQIRLRVRALTSVGDCVVGFCIKTSGGVPIFTSHWDDHETRSTIEKGISLAQCDIRPNVLQPGNYCVDLGIADATLNGCHDLVEDAICFSVLDSADRGAKVPDRRPGNIKLVFKWTILNL